MSEETQLGVMLLGIVVYKTIELGVVRKKIEQAYWRGRNLEGRPAATTARWWLARLETVREEYYLITMLYFMIILLSVGMFAIFNGVANGGAFVAPKALTLVTVAASLLIASLNLFVEHFRTLLEQLS